jgi:hypothetical protein
MLKEGLSIDTTFNHSTVQYSIYIQQAAPIPGFLLALEITKIPTLYTNAVHKKKIASLCS